MPLCKLLDEHDIELARERGWEARTNGDLLDLAEAKGYRVVVSTDKGIPYQQKLEGRQIGVVVVPANWGLVRELVGAIRDAIAEVGRGTSVEVAHSWGALGRQPPAGNDGARGFSNRSS